MRLKKTFSGQMFKKPAFGLSLLGLSLAGCMSASPHFYGLGEKPVQVVAQHEKMGPIKVFQPFVPTALDRDMLVRRVGKYEMTLFKAVWSEPVAAQIATAFTKDLAKAMPNELVYRQNNMVAEKAKIGIDLTVNAFALDEKGYAVVEGLTSFSPIDGNGKHLAPRTRSFSWRSKKYADKGPQTEIDMLSEGVAAWAQDTASFMANGGLELKAEEEDARLAQREKEADRAEKEMRQAQMIHSANKTLLKEQKKISKNLSKKK